MEQQDIPAHTQGLWVWFRTSENPYLRYNGESVIDMERGRMEEIAREVCSGEELRLVRRASTGVKEVYGVLFKAAVRNKNVYRIETDTASGPVHDNGTNTNKANGGTSASHPPSVAKETSSSDAHASGDGSTAEKTNGGRSTYLPQSENNDASSIVGSENGGGTIGDTVAIGTEDDAVFDQGGGVVLEEDVHGYHGEPVIQPGGPLTLNLVNHVQVGKVNVVEDDEDDAQLTPYLKNVWISIDTAPLYRLKTIKRSMVHPVEHLFENYARSQFEEYFQELVEGETYMLRQHNAFAPLGSTSTESGPVSSYVSLQFDRYAIDRFFYLFYYLGKMKPPRGEYDFKWRHWMEMVLWRVPHHDVLMGFRRLAVREALEHMKERDRQRLKNLILPGTTDDDEALLLQAYRLFTRERAVLLENRTLMMPDERFSTKDVYRLRAHDGVLPNKASPGCPVVLFVHQRWPSKSTGEGTIIASLDVWLPPPRGGRALAAGYGRGLPTDGQGRCLPILEHLFYNPKKSHPELPPISRFELPAKFRVMENLRNTETEGCTNVYADDDLPVSYSMERAILTRLFLPHDGERISKYESWFLFVKSVNEKVIEVCNTVFPYERATSYPHHEMCDPTDKVTIRLKAEILARLLHHKVVLVSLDDEARPYKVLTVSPAEEYPNWPTIVLGIQRRSIIANGPKRPRYFYGLPPQADAAPAAVPAEADLLLSAPRIHSRDVKFSDLGRQSCPHSIAVNVDSLAAMVSCLNQVPVLFDTGLRSNTTFELYTDLTSKSMDASRFEMLVYLKKGHPDSYSLTKSGDYTICKSIRLFCFPSAEWGEADHDNTKFRIVITLLDTSKVKKHSDFVRKRLSTPWTEQQVFAFQEIQSKALKMMPELAKQQTKADTEGYHNYVNCQYYESPSGKGSQYRSGKKINRYDLTAFRTFCKCITDVCDAIVARREYCSFAETEVFARHILHGCVVTAYAPGTKVELPVKAFKGSNLKSGEDTAGQYAHLFLESAFNEMCSKFNPQADAVRTFDIGFNTICEDMDDSFVSLNENAANCLDENLKKNFRLARRHYGSKKPLSNLSIPTLAQAIREVNKYSFLDQLVGLSVSLPNRSHSTGTIVSVEGGNLNVTSFGPKREAVNHPSVPFKEAQFDALYTKAARKCLLLKKESSCLCWAILRRHAVLWAPFNEARNPSSEEWKTLPLPKNGEWDDIVCFCPFACPLCKLDDGYSSNLLFGCDANLPEDEGDDSSTSSGSSLESDFSHAHENGGDDDDPFCEVNNDQESHDVKICIDGENAHRLNTVWPDRSCATCWKHLFDDFPYISVLRGEGENGKQLCYALSALQCILSSSHLVAALKKVHEENGGSGDSLFEIVHELGRNKQEHPIDISIQLADPEINAQVKEDRPYGSCKRFITNLLERMMAPSGHRTADGIRGGPRGDVHMVHVLCDSDSTDVSGWLNREVGQERHGSLPMCLMVYVSRKDREVGSFLPYSVSFPESLHIKGEKYVLKSLVLYECASTQAREGHFVTMARRHVSPEMRKENENVSLEYPWFFLDDTEDQPSQVQSHFREWSTDSSIRQKVVVLLYDKEDTDEYGGGTQPTRNFPIDHFKNSVGEDDLDQDYALPAGEEGHPSEEPLTPDETAQPHVYGLKKADPYIFGGSERMMSPSTGSNIQLGAVLKHLSQHNQTVIGVESTTGVVGASHYSPSVKMAQQQISQHPAALLRLSALLYRLCEQSRFLSDDDFKKSIDNLDSSMDFIKDQLKRYWDHFKQKMVQKVEYTFVFGPRTDAVIWRDFSPLKLTRTCKVVEGNSIQRHHINQLQALMEPLNRLQELILDTQSKIQLADATPGSKSERAALEKFRSRIQSFPRNTKATLITHAEMLKVLFQADFRNQRTLTSTLLKFITKPPDQCDTFAPELHSRCLESASHVSAELGILRDVIWNDLASDDEALSELRERIVDMERRDALRSKNPTEQSVQLRVDFAKSLMEGRDELGREWDSFRERIHVATGPINVGELDYRVFLRCLQSARAGTDCDSHLVRDLSDHLRKLFSVAIKAYYRDYQLLLDNIFPIAPRWGSPSEPNWEDFQRLQSEDYQNPPTGEAQIFSGKGGNDKLLISQGISHATSEVKMLTGSHHHRRQYYGMSEPISTLPGLMFKVSEESSKKTPLPSSELYDSIMRVISQVRYAGRNLPQCVLNLISDDNLYNHFHVAYIQLGRDWIIFHPNDKFSQHRLLLIPVVKERLIPFTPAENEDPTDVLHRVCQEYLGGDDQPKLWQCPPIEYGSPLQGSGLPVGAKDFFMSLHPEGWQHQLTPAQHFACMVLYHLHQYVPQKPMPYRKFGDMLGAVVDRNYQFTLGELKSSIDKSTVDHWFETAGSEYCLHHTLHQPSTDDELFAAMKGTLVNRQSTICPTSIFEFMSRTLHPLTIRMWRAFREKYNEYLRRGGTSRKSTKFAQAKLSNMLVEEGGLTHSQPAAQPKRWNSTGDHAARSSNAEDDRSVSSSSSDSGDDPDDPSVAEDLGAVPSADPTDRKRSSDEGRDNLSTGGNPKRHCPSRRIIPFSPLKSSEHVRRSPGNFRIGLLRTRNNGIGAMTSPLARNQAGTAFSPPKEK